MKNLCIKYPRTYHLPWSLGASNDDKILKDFSGFYGKTVVVTEKMDGENTSITPNECYARSINSGYHESRSWVRRFASEIQYYIPHNYRICGENLYATHSIEYNNLKSYFYGFSVWEGIRCLSWKETLEWFDFLGIISVPILYYGKFNINILKNIELDIDKQEGFVVRIIDEFNMIDFNKYVAKYVRKNHLTTSDNWMNSKIRKNGLY
jgi:hypothetical protein